MDCRLKKVCLETYIELKTKDLFGNIDCSFKKKSLFERREIVAWAPPIGRETKVWVMTFF